LATSGWPSETLFSNGCYRTFYFKLIRNLFDVGCQSVHSLVSEIPTPKSGNKRGKHINSFPSLSCCAFAFLSRSLLSPLKFQIKVLCHGQEGPRVSSLVVPAINFPDTSELNVDTPADGGGLRAPDLSVFLCQFSSEVICCPASSKSRDVRGFRFSGNCM